MGRRIIYGNVDGDGTKSSHQGEGFEVSRLEEGKYQISFRPEFGIRPSVVANWYSQKQEKKVVIYNVMNLGTHNCTVWSLDLKEKPIDSGFSFIAIGK